MYKNRWVPQVIAIAVASLGFAVNWSGLAASQSHLARLGVNDQGPPSIKRAVCSLPPTHGVV